MSRSMFRFPGLPALLALGLIVLLGVISAACDEPPPRVSMQELVAPPGVPEAPAPSQEYVKVRLEAIETTREIAPGVTYTLWTFNDWVPGPLIRAHEGDTVEITLHNAGTSTVTHNIDLHAVNGPGGGADVTSVAPGETKVFTFKAMSSGLFTYHCAAGLVADHIANGMYGGILVEPRNGLPKVDHEYYVGQSDMYTDGPTNQPGEMQLDLNKLLAEQPTYVVFNGHSKALTGNGALTAQTGESVRIYFVVGGPNLTSSFHVIGEIFDRAWPWGSLESLPTKGVQTISVPPGGSAIVQFEVDVPGDYKLVDHALGRVAKGALGVLKVTGQNDSDIFDVPGGMPTALSGHDMNGDVSHSTGVEVVDGATTIVTMTDSKFEPKAFRVAAGATVTFETRNKGKLPHNMRIATLSGDYESPQSTVTTPEIVNGGATGKLTWIAPAEKGAYKFRCDVHPVDMTGTITVE